MKRGILVVVSGFSGAGKGTIMKELLRKYDDYHLSVSATTRTPREGEVDGKHYYFRTKDEFQEMIAKNQLIEWAEYVGNYYGTPREYVESYLNQGKDVLLEIEMQGGMLIKEQYPDALLLFVAPPSAKVLQQRLSGRGTESKDEIKKRLSRAVEEVKYMKDYDYILINDVLEESVEKVNQCIQNYHYKTTNCMELIEKMETELAAFAKDGE